MNQQARRLVIYQDLYDLSDHSRLWDFDFRYTAANDTGSPRPWLGRLARYRLPFTDPPAKAPPDTG